MTTPLSRYLEGFRFEAKPAATKHLVMFWNQAVVRASFNGQPLGADVDTYLLLTPAD